MATTLEESPRRGGSRRFGLATTLAVALAVTGIGAGVPFAATAAAAPTGSAAAAEVSVGKAVTTALAAGQAPAVLVKFRGKADLSHAFTIADRDARAIWVYETLTRFADKAQAASRRTLSQQFGLSQSAREYRVLWIDNSIAISGLTQPMLSALQASPNIASIHTQRIIPLPVEELANAGGPTPQAVIGSIAHINAPDVWALGYKGSGLVLANIDTGVRYTHQALVNQYRGNLGGGTFNHQYNWYDPYNHATTPRTTHWHGTHTMGTMLGDDGGTNQIGVAPEATWINCIGFGGSGASSTDAGLLECGQFMLAPTDMAGTPASADPTKRPDVVNNSWGDCGQTYDNWYEGVIDGWIAAGIAPVFSNGNSSNCGYSSPPGLNTVGNPARSGKVLGVGSTGNTNGQYASHSNWGPTDNPSPGLPNYADHFGFADVKPNLVAPGVNIRSAMNTGDAAYDNSNGTSMSSPAVAGVIGLMWDAAACLHGDYARTGTILMETATRIAYNTGSPSDGPGNIPNQATGWGEVNALAAVQAAQDYCAAGAPPTLAKSFAPIMLPNAGDVSTLTIKLRNMGQAGPSALTAALTDNLPAGLVVAPTPNAATTCSGGTVTAVAGSGSVTLASGASIPGMGTCTVTVDVTAGALGTYTNTIPSGALVSDNGTYAHDAMAEVTYGYVFPQPYCDVAFPSGVEPITKVAFAGINNPSPATGGPPLQDFTAIVGNVNAGDSLPIAVEGNTMGGYTTKQTVFIDWNQNGTFDSGESYNLTDLTNSTGTDGQQSTGTIAVPAGALSGDTRMRVTKRFSTAAGACNTTGYGQAEDYTLTVGGGAVTTWTVTPSVGTPSGTISPATAQTVNDGATATFTLTADPGFAIDNIGGTCAAGALTGSSYETGAITADCSVIANFAAAGAIDPVIAVAPASLSANQAIESTTTQTLSIANIGAGSLDWAVQESQPLTGVVSAHGQGSAERQSPRVSAARGAFIRNWAAAPMAEVIQDGGFEQGDPNPYWDAFSQNFGTVLCDASCSNDPENSPHSGSWWAWFGGIDAAETGYVSQDVIVASGTATLRFWVKVPFTSGLPADYMAVSIDGTELWRVTADAAGAYQAAYQQVTVDVSGYADDASHTVRFDSAVVGGGAELSNFMLDDVSLDAGGGGGPGCVADDLPWLSVSPTTGTTAAGGSSAVTVTFDSTGLAEGTYNANLCVTSNDPATPLVTVPVEMTVTGLAVWTVSPSVAAGSGTITPAVPQTVNDGDTVTFTLAPATGFAIDSITGTCGGTLTGNAYETAPITADCTVEANFVAIPAGLVLTIDDGRDYARYGQTLTYLAVLENQGSTTVNPASIAVTLPAEIDANHSSWVCLGAGSGASCQANGQGALVDNGVTLPAGRSLYWLVTAPVRPETPSGTVTVLATATDGASTVNASNDTTLVILRTGFDVPYGDGAELTGWRADLATCGADPVAEVLNDAFLHTFVLTPASERLFDTLWRASAADGSALRIERVNLGPAPLLRLVTVDTNGVEAASAWVSAKPGATLAIAIAELGAHQRVVLLEGATAPLSMALPNGMRQVQVRGPAAVDGTCH